MDEALGTQESFSEQGTSLVRLFALFIDEVALDTSLDISVLERVVFSKCLKVAFKITACFKTKCNFSFLSDVKLINFYF